MENYARRATLPAICADDAARRNGVEAVCAAQAAGRRSSFLTAHFGNFEAPVTTDPAEWHGELADFIAPWRTPMSMRTPR